MTTRYCWDAGYHYTRAQLDQFPDPDEAHARRGSYWTFDGATFVSKMTELRTKGLHLICAAGHITSFHPLMMACLLQVFR